MRAASSLAFVVALAGTARAEPSAADREAADRAFQVGRTQLTAGQYAEACASFETSENLDPQLGTQFNIAQCDAKLGKLVAALAIYRDLAVHDTNSERKGVSGKLAEELAPRISHLHLRFARRPPDLAVSIDGVAIAASVDSIPVDVGTHEVVTTTAGATARTPAVVRIEGTTIEVDLLAPVIAPVPAIAPPTTHHRGAIAALAIGGVAIGAGAVLGLSARGTWHDAESAAAAGDVAHANELSDSASTRGNLSTGLFVAGGVVAAVGVVLYLRAPHAERVSVAPTPGGATLSFRAQF